MGSTSIADHIAYAETDRFGNPIEKKTFPGFPMEKANISLKPLQEIFAKRSSTKQKRHKKPIVIEKLDFQKKKLSLQGEYSQGCTPVIQFCLWIIFSIFESTRISNMALAVHQVNPAFTSIIGRVNYAKRYGLSITSCSCILHCKALSKIF